MPRQSRYKGEFSTYHVIMRGNEKKPIFQSDDDKAKFVEIIQRTKKKYSFMLEAYCIMNNHVHLLINDNGNDISKVIKSINISYAYYYNQKYNRVGHLFQDRFKSEVVDDDPYLLVVSKYIHNNPVKAGLTRFPAEYRWSSCKAYIGQEFEGEDVVNTLRILGIFANNMNNAVKGYASYMQMDENIKALEIQDDIPVENNRHAIATIEEGKCSLVTALREIGISYEDALKNSTVRNRLIKEMRANSMLSLKEIGELFGGVSESRISRIVKKG